MSDPDFSAYASTPESLSVVDGEEVESAFEADPLRVVVSSVLAWVIPGLGHIASGRVMRGIVFAIIVLSLFLGGILLDGKVYRPESGQPLC